MMRRDENILKKSDDGSLLFLGYMERPGHFFHGREAGSDLDLRSHDCILTSDPPGITVTHRDGRHGRWAPISVTHIGRCPKQCPGYLCSLRCHRHSFENKTAGSCSV